MVSRYGGCSKRGHAVEEWQANPSGVAHSVFLGDEGISRADESRDRMTSMLTIQRRHSEKCPDRKKGLNYLRCRGRCPLRISGTVNERRIRESLKTPDLQRAARRLAELEN